MSKADDDLARAARETAERSGIILADTPFEGLGEADAMSDGLVSRLLLGSAQETISTLERIAEGEKAQTDYYATALVKLYERLDLIPDFARSVAVEKALDAAGPASYGALERKGEREF